MFIPFGELAPDIADLGTTTLDVARNVVPGENSWEPFPSLVSQSGALPSACRGFITVQQSSGQWVAYFGTATKIYKFNTSTQAFDDVTRLAGGDYALPEGVNWQFAPFGTLLIAVQPGDVPQKINVDSGSNFEALGDSPPTAGGVDAVGNYVILSNLVDDPRDIAWSDINNAEAWTPGVDGLADQQPFASGGPVKAVCGAAGLVIQERGVSIMVQTGDTLSFQFQETSDGKGTIAQQSAVKLGTLAFWLSEDGFYAGNSAEIKPISHGRVSKYFFSQLYRDRISQVQGTYDPFNTRIYWAYPTADTDYNDRIIGYDWHKDKWFEIEIITYALGRTASGGAALEDLDSIASSIEDLTITMDSRVYQGGTQAFAAIDADSKLAYFEGDPLAATIETGNYQLVPGRRSRVLWSRPIIEGSGGSSCTVQVGRRQRLADEPSWTGESAMQTSGRCPLNAGGFYHRFRVNIPAEADWSHTQGMDVDVRPEGVR